MRLGWYDHSCGLGSCCGLLLVALVAGCAGQGKVSGQVRFNGKPLPGGWITFRPADNRKNSVSAQIDENGHYEAELPAGEVKIAVDNRELDRTPSDPGARQPKLPPGVRLPAPPRGAAQAPAPPPPEVAPSRIPGSYVPIPARFYEVETSGLAFTVKPGEQVQDLELK
jgi:hypothetical protein